MAAALARLAAYLHSGFRAERVVLRQPLRSMLRLDYISCILTVISTILVGRRMWHGWLIAGANSVIVCVIAMRTSQFGFIPANLLCIGLYAHNVRTWRFRRRASTD